MGVMATTAAALLGVGVAVAVFLHFCLLGALRLTCGNERHTTKKGDEDHQSARGERAENKKARSVALARTIV